MTRQPRLDLAWDLDVVARLLPHRPPMLLVDRVERFVPGPRPRLIAGLTLRGDEPAFSGHFPGRPLWPGVFLGEGLAQAAGLLLGLSQTFDAGGGAAVEALASTEGAPPTVTPALLARLELALRRPVEPPAELRYVVRARGSFGAAARIDGRVERDGQTVAEGSIALALEAPR